MVMAMVMDVTVMADMDMAGMESTAMVLKRVTERRIHNEEKSPD